MMTVCAIRSCSVVTLLLGVVLLGATPLASRQAAADAPAQFRSGTDLVRIEVSVLDGRRRPITGLTEADFTVTDNGVPVPVEAFTPVELPAQPAPAATASWTRDVAPDLVGNDTAIDQGRLMVILMDRSIPVGQPTATARAVAKAAIERLGPGDLAAVVSTSGGRPQTFTADRARLLRVIEQRDFSSGVSAQAEEMAAESAGLLGGTPFNAFNDGRCLCGLCVLDGISRVAEALQPVTSRQKLLLFIGSDLILQRAADLEGCDARLKQARERLFTAVDRSGLVIHAVDPTGLATVGFADSSLRTPTGGRGNMRGGSGPGASMGSGSETDRLLQRQTALGVLPSRTGGRVVLNTNGPENAIPDILRESASYYVIGFRPSPARGNELFHRIKVSVRRSGANVHTRTGYDVGPPGAVAGAALRSAPLARASAPTSVDAQLETALMAMLPAPALPLQLTAAALAREGQPEARVATVTSLTLPAEFLADHPGRQTFQVRTWALDQTGRRRGMAQQALQLDVPLGRGPLSLQVPSYLDLPPGEYEIRVGIGHEALPGAATVFTQVTVPAFGSQPLALSDLVLTLVPTASGGPPTGAAVATGLVATAQRTFAGAGAVTGLVEVYQGTHRTAGLRDVRVRARVLDIHDGIRVDQVVTLAAATFGPARARECLLTIPLSRLAPGDYLLRVDAMTDGAQATRALRFRVE